ncbi:MFS transporter [Picrophilus oshimae]|uniref:Major Facilitator Superfamily protein n=1 Tax=Picrophilus torridus (strain ATCC 700027 / DSM 9790 / JCM 10055 / NBRC 100828 / KAW 2/3) TaxID=1122961 RepID=A0A8G2FVN9_PICTO|nr:MFS transporter [Picrophilus oshimae]SMD30311.1 Major Facilitator Superfamily protein [Picrophilus oshimae DSM 9789]
MILNSSFSRLGLSAYNLVIIWVILDITRSPVLAGLSDSMMTLPLMLSIIVGSFVDRTMIKKELAMAAMIIRISLILIISSLYYNVDAYIVLSIFISTFMLGFTSDIVDSVRASWTKAFLGEAQYKSGLSLMSFSSMFGEGLGFVISGIIIALGDIKSFIIINIIFIASLIPVIIIKHTGYGGTGSINEYIKNGIKFVVNDKRIKEIILIGLIVNFILGMFGILFISMIQVGFGLPAIYVSIVFGLFIFGVSIGSFTGQKIKGNIGVISVIIFAVIASALFIISILNNIIFDVFPVLIAGISIGIENVAINTSLIRIIPINMMSRIQGNFNTFTIAVTALSSVIGGLLYDYSGFRSFMILSIPMFIMAILIKFLKNFSGMEY